MTRWQLIWLAVKILCRLFFHRDISLVLDIFAPKVEPVPETVDTVAVKAPRMAYDVIKSRLTHIGILVLAFATYAAADGYFNAYDGLTKLNKRISGGVGINIAGGVITATGSAVVEGSIPFANVSAGTNTAYLGKNAAASSANAYKGNSAPSATEFSRLAGVTAPIQGQISSVRVTAESKPSLSNVVPTMNGVGAAGTGPTAARVDHVHPVDTSREPANSNIQAHISSTSNPHSVTKTQVGLGNVDNTSDLAKPISTATQNALNLKANTASLATVATTGSYTSLIDKPATYTLPTASTTVKGGIKVDGTTIVMDGNGVASATVSAGVTDVNGQTGTVTVTPANIGAATLTAFTNYTSTDRPARSEVATAAQGVRADTALQPDGFTLPSTSPEQYFLTGTNTANHNLGGWNLSPSPLAQSVSITKTTTGTHSGQIKMGVGIEYRPAGSGVLGANDGTASVLSQDAAVTIGAEKQNWSSATLVEGEVNGLYIVQRNGGAQSDGTGILVDAATNDKGDGTVGKRNNFNAILEGSSQLFSGSTLVKKQNVQFGVYNKFSHNGIGLSLHAKQGLHDDAILIQSTDDTNRWTDGITFIGHMTGGLNFSDGLFTGEAILLAPDQLIGDGTNSVTVAQMKAATTSVSNVAYDPSTWNGDTTHAPSKDAVRDKIESILLATGSGTVTNIATGAGLTGGPITTTGAISLADTTVTPGSYTNASFTVDQKGRVTAASSGSPSGVASVSSANSDIGVANGTTTAVLTLNSGIGANQIPKLDANGWLGVGTTTPLAPLHAKGGAGVVGSGTVSITQNTSTLTFSTSQTLAVGDVVQLASSASYLTVASGSGTSYTTASLYTAGTATNVAFTIYKPLAMVTDSVDTPVINVRGGSNTVSIGHNGGNTSWNASLGIAGATSALFKAVNTTASSTTQGAGLQAFQDDGAATDSGHRLGFLIFGGASDANHTLLNAASIEAYAASTFSASNAESYLSFRTTANGANSRSEKAKLDGKGNFTATTFTPAIPAATTYGATTTIDLSLGDSPSVTLTGNPTLAFSNPVAGQWHMLELIQDATGGRTVTWPSSGLQCTWRNADGTTTAPTQVTAANSHAFYLIHTKSTTAADCFAR